MISYIDTYKDQFGVEAICRVLKQGPDPCLVDT